jgi:uncharacterized cupin superfamily protein
MAVAALGMSRAVAAAPSERARRGDKEMPKIEIAKIQAQQIASYPKEFAPVISGREKQKIGDAAGLTQFGVNITRIKPGSASALRHWRELVLQEEAGETVLKAGDAAGFRAGSGVAHCLVNRSGHDAVYLEIGTRADSERVHYPDVDFMMERDSTGRRYFRKSGEPISD